MVEKYQIPALRDKFFDDIAPHTKVKDDKIDIYGFDMSTKNFTVFVNIDWCQELQKYEPERHIDIVTYSIFDERYLKDILSHKQSVNIIVSDKFQRRQKYEGLVQALSGDIVLKPRNSTHAKIVLIEPNIVYLSSQNINKPDWFNWAIKIEDEVVYRFYKKQIEDQNYSNAIDKTENFFKLGSSGLNLSEGVSTSTVKSASKTIPTAMIKYSYGLNWGTKLNGYRKDNPKFIICSYTLPKLHYIEEILNNLFKGEYKVDITLIVNSIAKNHLDEVLAKFPQIKGTHAPNIHGKMVLVETNTCAGNKYYKTWLSSQNFGTSGWFENTIRVEGVSTYRFFYNELDKFTNGFISEEL